jgi:hypothetical protein
MNIFNTIATKEQDMYTANRHKQVQSLHFRYKYIVILGQSIWKTVSNMGTCRKKGSQQEGKGGLGSVNDLNLYFPHVTFPIVFVAH